MAHGEFSKGNLISSVNPWMVIALAAFYKQEREMFERLGQDRLAFQSDYMLSAMEELAGLHLHNDKTYFTYGPGNDEYMRNTGEE